MGFNSGFKGLSMVQPMDLLVQTKKIYNELTLLISRQYKTS